MKLKIDDNQLKKLKSSDKVRCECYNCQNDFFTLKKEISRELKNKKGFIRFCSKSCSASFNNKNRIFSYETKDKIRRTLSDKYKILSYHYCCEKCGNKFQTKNKKRTDRLITCDNCKGEKIVKDINQLNSILELSIRTVQKILKKIGVSCYLCGWNKTTIDIHHINGRKIENYNEHSNLICLCPNCHRLAHEKKIEKEILINNNLINRPIEWKLYYNI